jgi:hypothetical protein
VNDFYIPECMYEIAKYIKTYIYLGYSVKLTETMMYTYLNVCIKSRNI